MIPRAVAAALIAAPLAARAALPTPAAGAMAFSDPPATHVTSPSANAGYYIGTAQCNSGAAMQITWLAQTTGTSVYPPTSAVYAIVASSSSASNCSSGTNQTLATPNGSNGATPSVETYTGLTLDQFLAAAGYAGACSGTTDRTVFVCAQLYNGTDRNTQLGSANGSFVIQVASPQAPAGASVVVTPGDSALNVSWTASAAPPAVKSYQAIARPPGCTTAACAKYSGSVTTTSATIGGLTNGVTYTVTVQAQSLGGNLSTESTPAQSGTPIPIQDFFDFYQSQGGRDPGGCATGGGAGLLAAGAALALLARLRRRS
jgi:hypothetical protein